MLFLPGALNHNISGLAKLGSLQGTRFKKELDDLKKTHNQCQSRIFQLENSPSVHSNHNRDEINILNDVMYDIEDASKIAIHKCENEKIIKLEEEITMLKQKLKNGNNSSMVNTDLNKCIEEKNKLEETVRTLENSSEIAKELMLYRKKRKPITKAETIKLETSDEIEKMNSANDAITFWASNPENLDQRVQNRLIFLDNGGDETDKSLEDAGLGTRETIVFLKTFFNKPVRLQIRTDMTDEKKRKIEIKQKRLDETPLKLQVNIVADMITEALESSPFSKVKRSVEYIEHLGTEFFDKINEITGMYYPVDLTRNDNIVDTYETQLEMMTMYAIQMHEFQTKKRNETIDANKIRLNIINTEIEDMRKNKQNHDLIRLKTIERNRISRYTRDITWGDMFHLASRFFEPTDEMIKFRTILPQIISGVSSKSLTVDWGKLIGIQKAHEVLLLAVFSADRKDKTMNKTIREVVDSMHLNNVTNTLNTMRLQIPPPNMEYVKKRNPDVVDNIFESGENPFVKLMTEEYMERMNDKIVDSYIGEKNVKGRFDTHVGLVQPDFKIKMRNMYVEKTHGETKKQMELYKTSFILKTLVSSFPGIKGMILKKLDKLSEIGTEDSQGETILGNFNNEKKVIMDLLKKILNEIEEKKEFFTLYTKEKSVVYDERLFKEWKNMSYDIDNIMCALAYFEIEEQLILYLKRNTVEFLSGQSTGDILKKAVKFNEWKGPNSKCDDVFILFDNKLELGIIFGVKIAGRFMTKVKEIKIQEEQKFVHGHLQLLMNSKSRSYDDVKKDSLHGMPPPPPPPPPPDTSKSNVNSNDLSDILAELMKRKKKS